MSDHCIKSGAITSSELLPLLPALGTRSSLSSNAALTAVPTTNGRRSTRTCGGGGQATVGQTILNLGKTCMGTGCLALAFACQQSGIVVFTLGLALIAAWNVYAVERLCRCLEYLPPTTVTTTTKEHSSTTTTTTTHSDTDTTDLLLSGNLSSLTSNGGEVIVQKANSIPTRSTAAAFSDHKNKSTNGTAAAAPPLGTATFGVVVWHAFGDIGLQAADAMMLILLQGIIVAYISAVIAFLRDTPLTLQRPWRDAVLPGLAIAFLSLVPDMGYLSRSSAVGLTVLIATFCVIGIVGVLDTQYYYYNHEMTNAKILQVWPESLTGLSHWFGVVVFGYGVVPLTYNYRESMAEPHKLVEATAIALAAVAVLYVLMGLGLYVLYPAVSGEVLHELGGGVIPVLARLAMVWVTITTAPLLVVPCAELIEGKWGIRDARGRAVSRLGIVTFAAIAAVLLPGFVQVLSFVGCACVGLIGFCLPPLLHIRLMLLSRGRGNPVEKERLVLDGVLLCWGIFATIVSTMYTIGKL
jgi:amino acid permease